MAQTPESKVKDKIKKILKQHGVYFTMPIGTGYGNAGVPDFLCCVPPRGGFLAIEAKANGNKTTALQDRHIDEILVRGGEAVVIDENELTTLEELLKQMTGKKL